MKKITRSQDERIIAGVCGGFAEYFGIDVTIVRLIWILITVFGGIGILAYILSIIIIPDGDKNKINTEKEDDDSDEKLLIWGVILIIVGVLLFFLHRPVVGLVWHTFSANWLNVVFAIILIVVGIYIFLNKDKNDDKLTNKIKTANLHLSETDKKIAGVCGGIGEAFNIDSTLVRLLWVLGILISAGFGILLYIICILVFNRK